MAKKKSPVKSKSMVRWGTGFNDYANDLHCVIVTKKQSDLEKVLNRLGFNGNFSIQKCRKVKLTLL